MKVTALLKIVTRRAARCVLPGLLLLSAGARAQSFSITNITVPGAVSLAVSAMNASGHVAGYCYTAASEQRAFHWADGVGVDLGTLGGTVSVGNSLNNFGQVAGYSSSVGDTEYRAFSGVGLTLFDLGTLGGPVSTANHISDAGHVTGYSFVSPFSVDSRAFLIRNTGAMQDLGTLGGSSSSGNWVNNAGEVAGDSTTVGDSETHAFLYSGGSMRDLNTLGGSHSSARDLNDAGQVTGESAIAGDAETHAFLFDGSLLRDLGTLGGTYSTGYHINDAGEVIGDSQLAGDAEYHGFIFRNGTMTDLGTLGGGYSSAWGINNFSQVVGVSSNGSGQVRAFLWQNGSLIDLNLLLPLNSGWELTGAYFINDSGHIVGSGRHHGQDAWYLLTPRAPENQPPVANAGADQTVNAALVTVDGSASSDPDGDELQYAWYEGTVALGTTALLNVSLAAGSHTLTLRVTDPHEASAEDTVVVNVILDGDRTPPVVGCPDHQSASADAQGQALVPDLLASLVASDNVTEASALLKTQSPLAGTSLPCGTHRILITVADAAGNTTTCDVQFDVSDTTAPIVVCPADITRQTRASCLGLVPDLSRRVRVRDNCTPTDQLRFAQEPAAGTLLGPGDHRVQLTVTDAAGNSSRCTVLLHVVDICPPRIRALSADPQALRPADGRMVAVTLTSVATDNCDPHPRCHIASVTSSEPVLGEGDRTSPDWLITGDLTLKLRAEVSGKRAGRVYTIRVACTDASGNTSYRSVHVRAPRSK